MSILILEINVILLLSIVKILQEDHRDKDKEIKRNSLLAVLVIFLLLCNVEIGRKNIIIVYIPKYK